MALTHLERGSGGGRAAAAAPQTLGANPGTSSSRNSPRQPRRQPAGALRCRGGHGPRGEPPSTSTGSPPDGSAETTSPQDTPRPPPFPAGPRPPAPTCVPARLGPARPRPPRPPGGSGAAPRGGAGRGRGRAQGHAHECASTRSRADTRAPHTCTHTHRGEHSRPLTHTPTHTHLQPPQWPGVTLTGTPAAPGAEPTRGSAHERCWDSALAGTGTCLPERGAVPGGAGAVPGVPGAGPAPRSAAAQMSGPGPARSKQNSSAASHFPAAAAKNSKCRVVPAAGPRVPRRAGLGAGNTSCLGGRTCLALPVPLTVPT